MSLRRRAARLLLPLLAGLTCASAAAQSEDEPRLWDRIVALRDADTPAAYPAAFDVQIRQREALLAALRKYHTIFPGGAHRSEALALELHALFDLGALHGGDFDALCERAADVARLPQESDAAEGAYWSILCRRVEQAVSDAAPTSRPVGARDDALIAEYRAFIQRFPKSRHTPRLAKAVFDADDRAGDTAALRAVATALSTAFPQHPTTLELLGRLRRRDALGERFAFELDSDQGAVSNARLRDRVVLLVCWSADDAASRQTVFDVESYRKTWPDVAVVGVEMDVRHRRLAAEAAAAGISWPQARDGRGPASAFALHWGVTAAPFVFVLDPDHRLVFAGVDGWRSAADRARMRP